jgi:hypothetical protein
MSPFEIFKSILKLVMPFVSRSSAKKFDDRLKHTKKKWESGHANGVQRRVDVFCTDLDLLLTKGKLRKDIFSPKGLLSISSLLVFIYLIFPIWAAVSAQSLSIGLQLATNKKLIFILGVSSLGVLLTSIAIVSVFVFTCRKAIGQKTQTILLYLLGLVFVSHFLIAICYSLVATINLNAIGSGWLPADLLWRDFSYKFGVSILGKAEPFTHVQHGFVSLPLPPTHSATVVICLILLAAVVLIAKWLGTEKSLRALVLAFIHYARGIVKKNSLKLNFRKSLFLLSIATAIVWTLSKVI